MWDLGQPSAKALVQSLSMARCTVSTAPCHRVYNSRKSLLVAVLSISAIFLVFMYWGSKLRVVESNTTPRHTHPTGYPELIGPCFGWGCTRGVLGSITAEWIVLTEPGPSTMRMLGHAETLFPFGCQGTECKSSLQEDKGLMQIKFIKSDPFRSLQESGAL